MSFERASVWIEQEIGIAAYIMHVEKRHIPVIAFIHESVGREGMRDLLHLNPTTFSDEMEILAALPERLRRWSDLKPTGIVPLISATRPTPDRDGHRTGKLTFTLVNNTGLRITQLSGTVRIPKGILKHWSNMYVLVDDPSPDPNYRIFRFDEMNTRAIEPQTTKQITSFDFCKTCAIQDIGDVDWISANIVESRELELIVFINGKQYSNKKTLKDVLMEIKD
jgi:hypothetical protein